MPYYPGYPGYIPATGQPLIPTRLNQPQLVDGLPYDPVVVPVSSGLPYYGQHPGLGTNATNSQLVDLIKQQLNSSLAAALVASLTNQTSPQNASTPIPAPSIEKLTPKPIVAASSKVGPKLMYICRRPVSSALQWYYCDEKTPEGPYSCMDKHPPTDDQLKKGPAWTMLNSYRSGGDENVHWRYVEDDEDVENCLENWDYYEKDGTTLIMTVKGFSTTKGDNRRWCAKGQYRNGGAMGKQWAFCECHDSVV